VLAVPSEPLRAEKRTAGTPVETKAHRGTPILFGVVHREEPLAVPFVVEPLGPAETRASFRVEDSWCRTTTIGLRSGIRLAITRCQFEPSFSFRAEQPPADIELVVSKGGELRARTSDGVDLPRGGNTLQLGQTRRALPLQVRATSDVATECVSVSMSSARLRELLGVRELSQAFREVTDTEGPHSLVSRAMTPQLYRLLEEIANADVKGPARLLWHEAKSLELVACMTDELVATAQVTASQLSIDDVDRFERVRRQLVERLDRPPTLAQLARTAGVNETKLKSGFRALFGTPIFAYLRRARMEEARRLLLRRGLNVTEVAQRVGYANPSKFAAAFRREFAMPPSAV
jgi:AraC-like DNA-binding protein